MSKMFKLDDRALKAISEAQQAFFQHLAGCYPEVKSGDLSTEGIFAFDDACKEVGFEWLWWNYNGAVRELAGKFSDLLVSELGRSTVEEVNKRNDQETDSGVCHSHDFCDANMVMHQVFLEVVGVDICDDEYVNDEKYTTLWNEAWSLASKEHFFLDTLRAVR